MHLAIAGNIGAGKTTLARKLAEHFQWEACFESVEDNPYLADFYADMPRWAFHLQIYFLNNRFNQVLKVRQNHQSTVQDRTIYEDAHVFALNLRDSGLMTQRDYDNYRQVYDSMTRFITPPDLLIYLRADLPKLKSQIYKRGHSFESAIPDEYLINLNQHYENWIADYTHGKLLIVDMNDRDFVHQKSDWNFLLTAVEKSLGNYTHTELICENQMS
jgi:deoxyadenosine/deoxycytidine kinase